MNRKESLLEWDPCGFDWQKSIIEDGELDLEVPCQTCHHGVITQTPEQAAEAAWYDYGSEGEWDYFTDELSQLLAALAPNDKVSVEGANMGWLHRSGYATLDISPHRGDNRGTLFLRKAMPNTDFHLWAWALLKGEETNPFATGEGSNLGPFDTLLFEIAHHDAPTGGETYTVTAPTEDFEEA